MDGTVIMGKAKKLFFPGAMPPPPRALLLRHLARCVQMSALEADCNLSSLRRACGCVARRRVLAAAAAAFRWARGAGGRFCQSFQQCSFYSQR